jgi:hypothetical protein
MRYLSRYQGGLEENVSDKIPEVSPFVVDAITEMLKSDQGMLRPPEKAAHLLAVVCELHKLRQPFPPREDVARAIGASISTIDAAISTRLSEGYITLAVDTEPGNVQRRNSVLRRRYIIPSKRLLDVVAHAKRQISKKPIAC